MNDINYQNNNEIDLIELIRTLWNKKDLDFTIGFFGYRYCGCLRIYCERAMDLNSYYCCTTF